MPLQSIHNSKSDGALGAADTRAVFKSKGTSFLLNFGSNNEGLEFVLRPRPTGEFGQEGTQEEISVYDNDKAITGLVLNNGDELFLKADNIVVPSGIGAQEVYWKVDYSGDADFINSDTGEAIYLDQALTNLCDVGGCLPCPVGSGRLFENLIGRVVNFDMDNFIEQDQAASPFDVGLSGIDNGFVLVHSTTTDFEAAVTFVERHEFGLVEESLGGSAADGATFYPTFENWFPDGFDGVNNDPYFLDDSSLTIQSLDALEGPKRLYMPPTHGHLGWAFRFTRNRTGFTDRTYYACMAYDESTNTLSLVPDDPANPLYKGETGALGLGSGTATGANVYRNPSQFQTMRTSSGSGTAADPYQVRLEYGFTDVEFISDGDVDDKVYFELTLNFDDHSLATGTGDDHWFTVATYAPPEGRNNVGTNIKLFGKDNFTVKIGDASNNNRLDAGHSILVNSAFTTFTTDGFKVYVTVEKTGSAPVANDAFRVYFLWGRRNSPQIETDSGYTGQVTVGILSGTGTVGDPYVLDWDVVSDDFVFAMGTSPLYFATTIQTNNFRISTSAPSNPFLKPGDTLIEYYGTDSSYTTLVSSDDNSGPGRFSDLAETGTASTTIYFTVDVGSTGSTDEDRDGYRLRVQEDTGGGGAPGGNYTTLTNLVGGNSPGTCTPVKWNTRIVDIDFASFGAGSTMYYCVEDYTATSQGVSNRANTVTVSAADALTEDLGITSTLVIYDDAAFTNNIYDGATKRTFGDTPYGQRILDDNMQQIDVWDSSGDFSEGDTLYLAVTIDEGFDGYTSSGATLFDLEFQSMELDRYEDIADAVAGTVSGNGSIATPYVIPHQDEFYINNLDMFIDGSGGFVYVRVQNYQDSGAGANFDNDTLLVETSDVYNGGNNPNTEIVGYGTDSTFTIPDGNVADDNGFNFYSDLDLSGPVSNGQDYYFRIGLSGGSASVGVGDDFSLRVGRRPSVQNKLANFS